MKRFTGTQLGLWSLRIDALYCAIVGVAVFFWAEQVSVGTGLPHPLVAAAGIAVVAWAALVAWMSMRLRLRVALRLVMVVNIVAALLVATISVAAASVLVVLAILAVAFDVALFAASQAVALRRMSVRPAA